jgi:hypothetical protein
MFSRVFRSVGAGGLAALAAATMLAAAQPASARDAQSGWQPFRLVHDGGDHRWDRDRELRDQHAWFFDRDRDRDRRRSADWRRDRDRDSRRDWRDDRRRTRENRHREDHREKGWINPSGGGGS